ncbi:hypothetical protein [Aliterella atlantica]|uniref:hypothetical protein n=1 Tax=Aliterella atlantica TaxID=1827278 RepID=UPI00191031B0|nr:hypothetical protein [Aliterella atlantica]
MPNISRKAPKSVPYAGQGSSSKLLLVANIALTALLAIAPTSSQAASFIGDRAELQGNDQVDWSNLVGESTFKVLPNNFSTTSEQGLKLNVQIPQALSPQITPPVVFQTLPASPGIPVSFATGIPTNFASGDFILFTGYEPGTFPPNGNAEPLTIAFEQPVLGAGAQIAVNGTRNFVGSVAAFDNNDNLLGRFSFPGTSSQVLDNSAQFLGISSDTANISKLVFSTSADNRAFGINALSISAKPVPEPSSSAAATLGVAWFALLAIKRKQKT